MRILLDTNILLRYADSEHSLHIPVVEATRSLRRRNHELVIVPQSLYEFWAVATRTLKANGLGMTSDEAETFLRKFCVVFQLLRDERSIFECWKQLVAEHRVHGVNAHDVRLAAAMQRHHIGHFLTLNPSDFRRYDWLTVLDPADITAVPDEAPS